MIVSGVATFVLLLLAVVMAGAVGYFARLPSLSARLLAVAAVVYGGLAVSLLVHVISEDDYRDNGVSRWATYNAKPVTVIAIAVAVLAAALAVIGRRRPALVRLVPIAGVAAAMATYVAMAEMTN